MFIISLLNVYENEFKNEIELVRGGGDTPIIISLLDIKSLSDFPLFFSFLLKIFDMIDYIIEQNAKSDIMSHKMIRIKIQNP